MNNYRPTWPISSCYIRHYPDLGRSRSVSRFIFSQNTEIGKEKFKSKDNHTTQIYITLIVIMIYIIRRSNRIHIAVGHQWILHAWQP